MSERLPNNEWLHLAKATPIGSKRRCKHLNERRHNLMVGNEPDRWFAYCQSCKRGAIERKEHVLLGLAPPSESTNLSHPQDACPVGALPAYQRDMVLRFLAMKNMDMLYIESMNPSYSPSRSRLLLHTGSGLMGRDLTERSPQKWLTYDRQHFLMDAEPGHSTALVVEDAFSWAKAMYCRNTFALRVSVYCTLGTRIHDSLFLECLRRHNKVVSFYDGDGAGYAGALANSLRLRASGIDTGPQDSCAPFGLDPKDMTLEAMRQHMWRMANVPQSLFTI